MKLDSATVARIERFLDKIQADTYPEPPTELHSEITEKMFSGFVGNYPLPPAARILDVGCGQGVALDLFFAAGLVPVGITTNAEDIAACRQKGHDVRAMDQSFLDFPDESFDLIWCRHCLEHSVLPYFTLHEFARVLKPQGYLYVEVPAPDTSCQHQTNRNHYSVLGKSMWTELIRRTGLEILGIIDIKFTVAAGPDLYWAFIQRKP